MRLPGGLAVSWAGFYEEVWHKGQEGYAAELEEMAPGAREHVRTDVANAMEQLKLLRKQADEALKDLKALAH